MHGGMKEPLVGNEHIDDQSDTEILTSSALDDVVLKNGDVRSPERTTVDDTYIVSNVQPGIYSGFTPDYGTVGGRNSGPRGGVWTRKQVFGVDENKERGNWTGRFEYLLSMIGYAVGLGNVWRFPYLCYKYGGGAFLVPYLLFMTFVGIPLFYLESSLGQFTSCGPTTCWGFAPLFQGLGVAMMLSSFITSGYYCMIIAWCQFYFFASFSSPLPWSTCNEWWNTENCRDRLPDVVCGDKNRTRHSNGTCYHNDKFEGLWNYTLFKNQTGRERIAPSREYWENYVLRKGDGIEDSGEAQWRLVLCLLFSWALVFLCLIRGIKSAGKIVYFTAIFPYIVLLVLFFRGVFLDNAGAGINYYINPKFEKLLDIAVWKAAAVQIFYSMGPCWGGIVALSSYNRFHNNILRDSLIVSLGNCMTSIFAGFVIFSYVGYMAGELNVKVEHVADEGPGLAFVVYPEAILTLPPATMWSVLFFFMLITLGLDSQFATVEALLTGILDVAPQYRDKKTVCILIICVVMFLLGLPFTLKSGVYWVTLVDTYGAAWGVLMTGFIEVLAISYIYGVNRFCKDLETMIGPWRTFYWKICWMFITPFGIVLILLFSWIKYEPAKYNDYRYPAWAEGLGWLISFTAISAVPAVMVYKLSTTYKGAPLIKKMRHLLAPSLDWGPALVRHRQLIKYVPGFVLNPKDGEHGVSFGYETIPEQREVTVSGVTEHETVT